MDWTVTERASEELFVSLQIGAATKDYLQDRFIFFFLI